MGINRSKITVDRAEWDALHTMRDTYDADAAQARENLGRLAAVNRDQLARLAAQDMKLTWLHERVAMLQAELLGRGQK